jgi:hypothetical protein
MSCLQVVAVPTGFHVRKFLSCICIRHDKASAGPSHGSVFSSTSALLCVESAGTGLVEAHDGSARQP